jgi:hypothetical protein
MAVTTDDNARRRPLLTDAADEPAQVTAYFDA